MTKVELESMKGAELIAYADKLGVKVSCNKERTSLKESKSKVIDKIVAFEFENKTKEEKDDSLNSICYELKRTNRKNAETYTFKVGKTTVELCKNKKGITLYCSKNIIADAVKVGNKFKLPNVDINNLESYIKIKEED